MKFQHKEYHVSQTTSVAGNSFSVSMTAKLFETLFSGLYRYKEAAVLRELLCNAIDAHTMRDKFYKFTPSHYAGAHWYTPPPYLAGPDVKVEVHLPDSMEPWLEIKDFGIGLSLEAIIGAPIAAQEGEVLVTGNLVVLEDEIPDGHAVIGEPAWYDGRLIFRSVKDDEIIRAPGMYTTLFNSTKADSNDQIGAFGLGSKSPFSVSDSFTVESRYEGELHTFLMYLNADRIPMCELTTKDLETKDPNPLKTLEPNGLTVRVPVRGYSYNKFAEELADLCRVLEPHQYPVIINDSVFGGFTPILRTDRVGDTFIQETVRNSHASSHYAVMGGVAYPIEVDQLSEDNNHMLQRFPSTYTFFGLGDLNIPPSREDLTYDEFTLRALNAKLSEVCSSLMESIMRELEAVRVMGPMAIYIRKLEYINRFGGGFGQLLNKKFPDDPRFSGRNIREARIVATLDKSLPAVQSAEYNYMLGSSSTEELYPYTITNYTIFNRTEESFNIDSLMDSSRVETLKPVVFILDDRRNYVQKIKQFLNANPKIKAVWLVAPNKELLVKRDMELETQYHDGLEIRKEIAAWVGVKDKFDHMLFADKFCEYYEGLVNPEVNFLSDIPYQRAQITENMGLNYFMRGYQRHGNERVDMYRLSTDEIVKAMELGKQMVYIEMSGHYITHSGINAYQLDNLNNIVKNIYVTGKNGNDGVMEEMGFYPYFIMARKKSMKFLKENPEFFVDINDFIVMLREKFAQIMVGLEYKRFAGRSKNIRFSINNSAYHKWILEQLVNNGEGDNTAAANLYKSMPGLIAHLSDALDYTIECDTKYQGAEKAYGKLALKKHNTQANIMKLSDFLTEMGHRVKTQDERYENLFEAEVKFDAFERDLGKILKLDSRWFSLNKNCNTEKRNRSKKVMESIELYLVKQFVQTHYTGIMGSKLTGKEGRMQAIRAALATLKM